MRTPRRTRNAGASSPPTTVTTATATTTTATTTTATATAARGRRAHAGPPADEPEEYPAGALPASAGPTAPHVSGGGRARPATRSGPRPRTIRAKVVSLLMVPVVSLLALWGFATVTTVQDVARLTWLRRVDAEVREPVSAALAALQDERRAAVRQVAAPGTARTAELEDRMRRTDAAVDRLRLDDTHTVGDTGDLPDEVADRVSAFVGAVEGLALLRTAAIDGRADGDQVYAEYTGAISAAFAVGGALAGLQDAERGADARVLLEFGRAGEMLAREDALLGAAHLTGRFTADRLRAFSGAVETRRTLLASATADLPAAERAAWTRLTTGDDHIRLTRAEDRIGAASPGRPAAQAVTSADWGDPLTAVRDGLAAIETGARAGARAGAADRAGPFTGGLLTTSGAAVAFGLVAVAASLLVSVRIGRGLVVELVGLRNTALGIARRELPAAMRRLREGEEIDVETEAPVGPPSRDEIGQVGEALATVHRAALSAAAERAELADGVSGVFVNLARRSQVLVHRQLNLLDAMERHADDPDELGNLFRLDHLTTRMRRHAESLIILSGAAPGRAWRRPVLLTDVVRAAVSEIEDYARVEVRGLPETAVVGGAVADLTHLLAELIENATQFSPPHTKVRVSGEPVGSGYALEIEDRGLGMGRETLAEANARIARTESLDLFDSDRLGLFVVSRLSSRHDVKVQLQTSPYGGTTAVVLLPADLLQAAPSPESDAPAEAPGTREPDRPRPRPLPRPTAAPTRAARTEPGPTPAGVTALRPRGPSVPPPERERPSGAPGVPGARQGGLPRRVRQASLVPQLREAPASVPAQAAPGADTRTPEQVRDRMTAYRNGWQRGGGPVPGGRRPLGTGSAAIGTDPDPVPGRDDPRPAPHPEGDDA